MNSWKLPQLDQQIFQVIFLEINPPVAILSQDTLDHATPEAFMIIRLPIVMGFAQGVDGSPYRLIVSQGAGRPY